METAPARTRLVVDNRGRTCIGCAQRAARVFLVATSIWIWILRPDGMAAIWTRLSESLATLLVLRYTQDFGHGGGALAYLAPAVFAQRAHALADSKVLDGIGR